MPALWRFVFDNDRPVEIEIGPGTGTFLLPAAARDPQANFFGIEHSHTRAFYLQAAIATRRLENARVIAADASCVVATLIPAESVAAYHIYFPDPWWKRRHHRRRLLTPPLAAALLRTLLPGGRVYFATDVDDLFALALRTFATGGALTRDAGLGSPRTGTTVFERKGLARGATIHEATFVKSTPLVPSLHTSSAAPMTPAESPS